MASMNEKKGAGSAAKAALAAAAIALAGALAFGAAWLATKGAEDRVSSDLAQSNVLLITTEAPGWDGSGGPILLAVTGYTAEGDQVVLQAPIEGPDDAFEATVPAGMYAVSSTQMEVPLADGGTLSFQGVETAYFHEATGEVAEIAVSFLPTEADGAQGIG